jgi:phosphoglycolate phosphatase
MLEAAIAEAGARPETTAMIGDTSFDIQMAIAAGTHPIGVAWGYHDPEELHAAGAREVSTDARQLPAMLAAL